jgi:hypothetical protein
MKSAGNRGCTRECLYCEPSTILYCVRSASFESIAGNSHPFDRVIPIPAFAILCGLDRTKGSLRSMSAARKNSTVAIFVFAFIELAAGALFLFLGDSSGTTRQGIPFPIFAWICIALGLITAIVGFYTRHKNRSL